MGQDDDDADLTADLTTRVQSLMVSYRGEEVRILIKTTNEAEAEELAHVLVRHFKEYGAATIEIMHHGGTLQ